MIFSFLQISLVGTLVRVLVQRPTSRYVQR
nr:MAG TPA: hypothetical protein [Caudoviricetes sp.]